MKNNKGFALTEVLVLSTVIIGVLTFMYIQFKSINRSYQNSFNYDTVEGMYIANNIINYINEDNYDTLVENLNNSQQGYIDITNCDINLFETSSYCEQLFEKSKISKILFTEENLFKLKSVTNLENDLKNYVKQIKTTNSKTDYRIVIKYNNNTFASMRFNKGNEYVQKGLIAFLDGINNTGKGHSNDTVIWKDLSGNNNDATLYNNPVWRDNSIEFNGIDNYGILTNTANQPFLNGVTLETRVKILSLEGYSGYNYIMFIDNASSGSQRDGLRNIMYKDTNKFETPIAINNTYYKPNSQTQYDTNTYYTLTSVYDNEQYSFYIDGTLVDSVAITGTYNGSAKPLTLSARAQNLADYANVEFQNVLIYNRALSNNEVMRNYQADMARY
jgi:hypothetical protein